jgi:hypothetical protein
MSGSGMEFNEPYLQDSKQQAIKLLFASGGADFRLNLALF